MPELKPGIVVVASTVPPGTAVAALALLAVALASVRWPGAALNGAGWCFVVGTVLFSGSLYALSVTGVRVLGAITPFGGLAFIAGWILIITHVWRVS